MSNARVIDPAIIRGDSIPELEMSNSRFRNLGSSHSNRPSWNDISGVEISVEEAMVEMYL